MHQATTPPALSARPLLQRRVWLRAAAASGLALTLPARAAVPPLRGRDVDGRAFDPARLRGRVVLVFYWSTECAVCMSKWPELRANAEGWRGRMFTLVAINVDARGEAWREHERIVGVTHVQPRNLVSLRGDDGAAAVAGRRLPLTLVLDTQGAEVSRFEGRIPAEAWDDVASQLP